MSVARPGALSLRGRDSQRRGPEDSDLRPGSRPSLDSDQWPPSVIMMFPRSELSALDDRLDHRDCETGRRIPADSHREPPRSAHWHPNEPVSAEATVNRPQDEPGHYPGDHLYDPGQSELRPGQRGQSMGVPSGRARSPDTECGKPCGTGVVGVAQWV